jgi:hypothetical protein
MGGKNKQSDIIVMEKNEVILLNLQLFFLVLPYWHDQIGDPDAGMFVY